MFIALFGEQSRFHCFHSRGKSSAVVFTTSAPETEVTKASEPQIPPRPIILPEAAAYPKLHKVKATSNKHNHLIFEAERERNQPEIELSDLRGLARLTKKKELESKISAKNEEI